MTTQTTEQTNDRDAAIQIPQNWKPKRRCIKDGAVAEALAERGLESLDDLAAKGWAARCFAAEEVSGKLSYLIELLTSSNKDNREFGKERVRELVKLGREAAE